MTSKAFGRTTRPKLLCHSPKIKRTREIIPMAGRSSHMRNSIAQGRFGAIIQRQPLPWDESVTHGFKIDAVQKTMQ